MIRDTFVGFGLWFLCQKPGIFEYIGLLSKCHNVQGKGGVKVSGQSDTGLEIICWKIRIFEYATKYFYAILAGFQGRVFWHFRDFSARSDLCCYQSGLRLCKYDQKGWGPEGG
jgi:hypothetical protein